MLQNQEWIDQNRNRAYPLAEDMLKHPSVNGTVLESMTLPDHLLLDFQLLVLGGEGTRVWLSKYVRAGAFVGLEFSDVRSGALIATASANLTQAPGVIYLELQPVTPGAQGRVVIGNPDNYIDTWPDGIYEFESGQTELEFCCVRDVGGQLSGIRISDRGNLSSVLSGIVTLKAGENARLSLDPDTKVITVDVIPNAGYFADCGECPVADNIVRTVNGIPLKDLQLVSGNDCVDISVSGNKIIVTDKCSTPCCGCEELKLATQKLSELDTLTDDISAYRNNLSQALTLLEQALAQIPSGS